MIPDENTLRRFLRAKMNFFVYGPRASGKTRLLKKVFEEANTDFIYINCTMGDKKSNFFRYLNHEMDKFFKKKLGDQGKLSKTLSKSDYVKPNDPSSVHVWISNIKSLSPQIRRYLNNIYFFIDNIEEIHLSANFMTTFFSACQQNIVDELKIPFVFCGITLPKKIYAIDKPFRNIISFCMKKPLEAMKQIIQKITNKVFQKSFNQAEVKNKFTAEDIKNASYQLANIVFHAFEPMQTDLNRIKKMTHVLAKQVAEVTKKQMKQEEEMNRDRKSIEKTLEKRLHSKINKGQIKKYTRQMLQQGPVDDFLVQRKVSKESFNEQSNVQLAYEYYPNLFITSLHLADLAPQSEDKRRFQDYKKQKGKASTKNLDNRITKHNIQRVIAIAETLESQGKQDGPQFKMSHHSLNFYACIQYLREEEKIFFQGKNMSLASTKIHGDTKQEEARTFLINKMGLSYSEYDPKR